MLFETRRRRQLRSGAAGGLLIPVLLAGVERLARQLTSLAVEELDLEQVVPVVVGGEQREALVDQLALVDGEIGQLSRDDPPSGYERAGPHGRARATRRRPPRTGPCASPGCARRARR